MKRLLLVLLIGLFAAPAGAQETIDPDRAPGRGFRFYLAPVVQASQVNSENAVVTGLEFGWMVTPRFTLGLATYRLGNGIPADRPDLDGDGASNVEFFYSGLTAAYAVDVAPRTRLIGQALVGGAEAHWRSDYWAGMPDPKHRDADHRTSFVVEPGVGVEVELLPWTRAYLGGGYRYVGGGESNVLEQSAMRGFTASFGLRFGRF